MEIPGYEIKRLIGQGGMATAYLAEQRSLGRQVVLKVLDTGAASPETVERFLNEGRIIASLNHPHIITIYDIGQSGDNVFISMEYVEGGDLKQRMQSQRFAPVEAIDIVAKIAAGLAVAHASGIVHRDVKPGNILFRKDGTPLLSDFGIAKRLTGDADLTSAGMFVGSPNYMAPEQSESGPIDGRADLYALGVILYEMLTRERAYPADSVIDVILLHKRAPVPQLPPGLEAYQELLTLMMAKQRNERFRDAESLLHFIAQMRKTGVLQAKDQMAAQPDIGVTAEHPLRGPPTRASRGRRRLRLSQWIMFGMLLVCLGGWAALFVIERRLEPPPVPRAVSATMPDAAPAAPDLAAGSSTAQIGAALLWLGRHSLDEFRLTAPPRDNAYYYFSRLLQLDPDDAGARAGMRGIAARYAMLAESAIAEDRFEQARSFIAIGLQIDPTSQALLDLRELASGGKVGFWDAFASFFK